MPVPDTRAVIIDRESGIIGGYVAPFLRPPIAHGLTWGDDLHLTLSPDGVPLLWCHEAFAGGQVLGLDCDEHGYKIIARLSSPGFLSMIELGILSYSLGASNQVHAPGIVDTAYNTRYLLSGVLVEVSLTACPGVRASEHTKASLPERLKNWTPPDIEPTKDRSAVLDLKCCVFSQSRTPMNIDELGG